MMRANTAYNRLEKRAKDFFGMTLDEYLITFTYERDGRLWFNENATMNKCWNRINQPRNAEEALKNLWKC